MEEKKKRTITKVEKKVSEEAVEPKKAAKRVDSLTTAEEKSKATTLRIVAFILWAVAIACEVIAILLINEKIKLPFFSTHDLFVHPLGGCDRVRSDRDPADQRKDQAAVLQHA